jgi:dolichol-phosphate mannosyltransferase
VLEVDCDFSHDPDDVPRLIAASREADLVLGSRYVPGGRIENWGALRRFVSRVGSLYAQTLLAVPVRDLTGGFKCYRREVLERIDLDAVVARGYAFQIETTYRALRAGFRVVEVPITFVDRRVGTSKMSPAIATEAIWRVPYLRALALAGRLR